MGGCSFDSNSGSAFLGTKLVRVDLTSLVAVHLASYVGVDLASLKVGRGRLHTAC